MNYIGKNGFGITTTCHRDSFPKGLKDYFHHKKVPSHDMRTRVALFDQPIFAVKRVEKDNDKKAYTQTFVSFQSTGAWATEQNEGKEIYLSHYHGVTQWIT
jgi:hypothetical protein